MQTKVIGMGQVADEGVFASKPHTTSANYINRMSDYCKYEKGDLTGDKACPFNFFYWDFLLRHQDLLRALGRMNLILSHLKRIAETEALKINSLARQRWHNN